jgi:hypothetical protein
MSITEQIAHMVIEAREEGWRDAIAQMGADPDLYTRMARVIHAAREITVRERDDTPLAQALRSLDVYVEQTGDPILLPPRPEPCGECGRR